MDYIKENSKIPGRACSLWLSGELSGFSTLKENKESDVVIVGGGITGFLCAFLLSRAGHSVIILDATKIAGNTTGHTTGKITIQHGLIYSFLLSKIGRKTARRYKEANEAGANLIEEIIEQLGIDCDYKKASSYLFSENKLGASRIFEEFEAQKELKLKPILSGNSELPFQAQSLLELPNQAHFHATKFIYSLSQHLLRANSLIYENSKVSKVSENSNGVSVRTSTGHEISARKLIIATNFPIYDTGNFYIKLYPKMSYAYAITNKNKIKGMYYGIYGNDFRSIRPQDDMLIIGGKRHKTANLESNLKKCNELETYINNNFENPKFHYHWSTEDFVSLDRIPYIGYSPGSKNIYVATGYGGWGMTNSAAAAILLTGLIEKDNHIWKNLFNPERIRVKDYGLFGRNSFSNVRYFSESKISHRFNGRGPFCTHLGCKLHKNDAEGTLDCPCHGSRFKGGGEVLYSPAVKDLKEVKNE